MKHFILFLTFIISFFADAQALSLRGKVVAVKDGDTFKVLYNNREHTIRLAHIDCPEKKQPFGTKAKQYASALCFGKNVLVKSDGKTDRNGRIIGEIFVENICVNKELVNRGLAWHFKKYSKSKEYAQLEHSARQLRVGLWSDPRAIAPWDWRKGFR